jgi:hypothetical protein
MSARLNLDIPPHDQDGSNVAGAPTVSINNPDDQGPIGDYFAHWFDRVNAAQASQPHWITPVATVTPRLEEEFRFDFGFQQLGNGAAVTNYGMGKGLELIPTTSNEILFNIPNYEIRTNTKQAEGFGDDPFFVVKQRLLSANEETGNYILTGFLSIQAPTGITAFTNDAYVITTTIAGGKGYGSFDIQATIGVSYPLSHETTIGTSVATNVTFQYHVTKILWPEFEVNYTYWTDGGRGGKNQIFLTPGVVFGRFPVTGRLKAIVGVAYQIAVTPKLVTLPALTPLYNSQFILTTRLAF